MAAVDDRVVIGARHVLVGLVLDLEEDAEVAHALRLLGRALEVGHVLGDVRVEEAGDRDVVEKVAELQRLALDRLGDLFALLVVAAAGDRHCEGEDGQKADDGGDSGPHARRESMQLIGAWHLTVAWHRTNQMRSPPATAIRSGGAPLSATPRRRSSAFFRSLPSRRSDDFASRILSTICSGSVMKVT